ncbi:MAG: hypothetical protein ACI4XM_06650 [Candidatus Coprovivens sp.]
MSDKNNKVSVFYGRARRLELYEKIIYVLVAIVAVVLIFVLVTSQSSNTESNVNYAYLKQYLYERGFVCDMIHKSGGKCRKENNGTSYVFTRYDDGFEYLVKTDSYFLIMSHSLQKENSISFSTTSEAFAGYKNKEYNCELGDNVLDTFGECKTKNGEVLNLNSYRGVIEQAQKDVNNMIDSSGYYKKNLMEDYQWIKK